MMDADYETQASKFGIVDQNGVHIEHLILEEKDDVQEEVNVIPDCDIEANLETVGESNDIRMIDQSTQNEEELTGVHAENKEAPTLLKVDTKETDQVKAHKQQSWSKKEKPSNAKRALATSLKNSLKKTNDNKEMKATSNGSVSVNTQPKKPVAKTRSFNDRQTTSINPSKTTKSEPTTSNTHKTKVQLPKSETASGSDSSVQSDGTVEKAKLEPLRKGPPAKAEGNGESVESPTASEIESRRGGKLPSYGFSFKCNERAEKRKEYFSKLEERIHAQELEKNNQQAKSKESQEAEIKMFRKSLNFKATPMPSFYQEPPPPKVELKKIPTTRPRSPKLGRKKSSSTVEAEGEVDRSHQPTRLSLDEKAVSQNNGKGPSSQPKRPQRKSLPRLPSEKTRLSKAAQEGGSPAQVQDNVINGSAPIASITGEDGLVPDPVQALLGTENRHLVEDQALPTIDQ